MTDEPQHKPTKAEDGEKDKYTLPKKVGSGFIPVALAGGVLIGLLIAVIISIMVGSSGSSSTSTSNIRSTRPTTATLPPDTGQNYIGGSGGSSGSDNGSSFVTGGDPAAIDSPDRRDISLTTCGPDERTGRPAATVVVTNHTSQASDYIVGVAFQSRDGSSDLGNAVVTVSDVRSGRSSHAYQLTSSKTNDAGGPVACELMAVTRYPS